MIVCCVVLVHYDAVAGEVAVATTEAFAILLLDDHLAAAAPVDQSPSIDCKLALLCNLRLRAQRRSCWLRLPVY